MGDGPGGDLMIVAKYVSGGSNTYQHSSGVNPYGMGGGLGGGLMIVVKYASGGSNTY